MTFAKHPWSIGGGGVADLKAIIEEQSELTIGNLAETIGFGAVTREDDVFLVSDKVAIRHGVPCEYTQLLVSGEDVRNWQIQEPIAAVWPYDLQSLESSKVVPIERFLWSWRPQLSSRVAFGLTQTARGLRWFEYSMFFRDRFRSVKSIVYAQISTHNHFAMKTGGKVFSDTAPM